MSDQDDLTKELESIFDEEGHRLSATMHLEKLLGIPDGRLEFRITTIDTPEIDEAGEPVDDPYRRIHAGVHELMDMLELSMDITDQVMKNERKRLRAHLGDDHPIAAIMDMMASVEDVETTDD